MRIAIVMIASNGWDHLQHTIPRILNTTPADCDFYLIYNIYEKGGADQLVTKHFPRVRVLPTNTNMGFAPAYNWALRQITDADIYVIINHDVYVEDGWLERMVEWLERSQRHAAVQPKILSWRQPTHFEYAGGAGGWIDALGIPFCRGRVLDTVEEDRHQYDHESYVFWASGACMAVKREAFWGVGGFEESFFLHMDEVDLCWRLQLAGWQVGCVPSVRVYHVGGATVNYYTPIKVYTNFKHNLVMLAKNMERNRWWWVQAVRQLTDCAAGAYLLLSGKVKLAWEIVRAHRDFWLELLKGNIRRFELVGTRPFTSLTGVYRGSIVLDYYLRRKRTFAEIVEV